MRICVIGTGYVGLVAGTCFADMGNNVICVDNDNDKLNLLSQGIVPIYEPLLDELVKSNLEKKRLKFTSDLENAVKESEICFIAVGTPQHEDGSANLHYVFEVAEQIAKSMNGHKIIVQKSTVPVGTIDKLKEIISENTKYSFDVISNPEFLKQGNAVDDFINPDRVIVGADSIESVKALKELYTPFFKTDDRFIVMDIKSAEMTKYVANSFLATKISFINEIANLCEKTGADIEKIRLGIISDSRIGNQFLYPGIGYGGSCFPKDVKAIIKTGDNNNCEMKILKSVDAVNTAQKKIFLGKILNKFGNDLSGKTFALWGLSYKPQTDDMRDAPSIGIVNGLLECGASVKAYDPRAIGTAKKIFADKINYASNSYIALKDADALLLLTEWNEFKRPDFDKMKLLMKSPVIFDGRNQYDCAELEQKEFEYYKIGK